MNMEPDIVNDDITHVDLWDVEHEEFDVVTRAICWSDQQLLEVGN